MDVQVAVAAQGDQVLLRIIPGLAAKFLVNSLHPCNAQYVLAHLFSVEANGLRRLLFPISALSCIRNKPRACIRVRRFVARSLRISSQRSALGVRKLPGVYLVPLFLWAQIVARVKFDQTPHPRF